MPVGTFVDTEGAVRAWARAHTGIAAVASGGVFFGIPDGGGSYPMLTIARVGGGPLTGDEAPIDRALIQFDAWGNGPRDKAGAAALATAVVNAAHLFTDGTAMGDAVGLWAEVPLGPIWSPDPQSGRARYVVDVAFGLRSAV